MSWMKMFSHEKEKNGFERMSKKEKGSFLKNDFIKRMIRVEQHVSSSLGEKKPYHKTNYYKSLTKPERERFDKYLKDKQEENKLFYIALSLLSLLALIFAGGTTGNAVKGIVGESGFSFLFIFIFVLILVLLLIGFISYSKSKKHSKKIKRYCEVLDEIRFRRDVANMNI